MIDISLPEKSAFRIYERKIQQPKGRKNIDARIISYQLKFNEVIKKWGWADKPNKEKRALRHSIIEDLFEYYIAPASFTHTAWDIVFEALDTLNVEGILVWSKEMARDAVERGTRKRLIWCIEHAGVDRLACIMPGASNDYIQSVSNDKFGKRDWKGLTLKNLEMLLWTIKSRVRRANLQGKNLWKKDNSEAVDDGYVESDPDDLI